jgi:hypothetical protein
LGVDGGFYFVGQGRAPVELVIAECKLQRLTPSARLLVVSRRIAVRETNCHRR